MLKNLIIIIFLCVIRTTKIDIFQQKSEILKQHSLNLYFVGANRADEMLHSSKLLLFVIVLKNDWNLYFKKREFGLFD